MNFVTPHFHKNRKNCIPDKVYDRWNPSLLFTFTFVLHCQVFEFIDFSYSSVTEFDIIPNISLKTSVYLVEKIETPIENSKNRNEKYVGYILIARLL